MSKDLLKEYGEILNRTDDVQPKPLNEGLLTMFAAGAAIKWLMTDDQEEVADALEEVQDVITDLQDAVENMIGNIEQELIADVIMEQGAGARETIQAGIEEAKAAIQEAVAGAIEGDEELMNEVPLGEAGKMANIAILAAVAGVVAGLTAPE